MLESPWAALTAPPLPRPSLTTANCLHWRTLDGQLSLLPREPRWSHRLLSVPRQRQPISSNCACRRRGQREPPRRLLSLIPLLDAPLPNLLRLCVSGRESKRCAVDPVCKISGQVSLSERLTCTASSCTTSFGTTSFGTTSSCTTCHAALSRRQYRYRCRRYRRLRCGSPALGRCFDRSRCIKLGGNMAVMHGGLRCDKWGKWAMINRKTRCETYRHQNLHRVGSHHPR